MRISDWSSDVCSSDRSASLGQPQFGQEVGALLHRLLGVCAKAQVAQPRAAAYQLLVEPGGTYHAGLPLNRQVRFQLHGHTAYALRVVLATTLGQIVRPFPYPLAHALHPARPASGFQSPTVGLSD